MNEQTKKILLDIARRSVEAAVKHEPLPQLGSEHPHLQGMQGIFVTLRTHGQLRGCIGRFVSDIPLYQLVSEMAVSSAMEDTRFEFNRIRPSELPTVEIELSVLSPLTLIQDPLDFELGRHGIFIKKGFHTGCFLAQVATETGWNKEEFLSHCCENKAGLPPDAWKRGDIEIYIFTAELIEEEKGDSADE